ncbi:amidohydrolase [Paenibacillus campi]|uniref:amidohydrolase n=1 Tax=Paenibacillus campi TaxID=3106031 RepID=UPI002AFFEDC2|nr:amidohydrolase [Paenibacillus sp. SGZ-1009]
MPTSEALQARLVEVRRHLHRHPELSGAEVETTAYLRHQLLAADIRLLELPGVHTGVVAEIGHGEGHMIALRGDIDALPVQEATGLPFASSVQGRMHACGHDFHAAALLGAAYLLKQREAELPGRVRLIFQPSEEKATGAQQLIAAGVLDGVDAVFGLHNKPDLSVGEIGVREGPLMAAADGFRVEVRGRGSHAAVPDAGIDPIVAAAHIITALQSIVSRNISAQDSAVISVTRLHSGQTWNVIPELAHFQGTIRTFDTTIRRKVRQQFEQVVQGVASAFGTDVTIQWIDGPPPVQNAADWTPIVRTAVAAAGLQAIVPAVSPASEDFAFYQQQRPGVFIFVGTSGPQEWHHPSFDVDERALAPTASVLTHIASHALDHLTATKATASSLSNSHSISD